MPAACGCKEFARPRRAVAFDGQAPGRFGRPGQSGAGIKSPTRVVMTTLGSTPNLVAPLVLASRAHAGRVMEKTAYAKAHAYRRHPPGRNPRVRGGRTSA